MYRVEHLPFALYMGLREYEFWEMNPRLLKPYIKAHELRMKHEDEIAWLNGTYVLKALLSTVGNMFSKNTAKPFEYPQRPEMSSSEERELSKEEIARQTQMFFASLETMKTNFELNKQQEVVNGSN